MDLERLDEAFEVVASGGLTLDSTDVKALLVIVPFAIDAWGLLADGERVEWCEEHETLSAHVDLGHCRIVPKLLIDPPTEED